MKIYQGVVVFLCLVGLSVSVAIPEQKQLGIEKSVETGICSGILFMEVVGTDLDGSVIFLNGTEIGKVPVVGNSWKSVSIRIPESCLGSIATVNHILIENRIENLFKIRNVYLSVIDKKKNTIKSNIIKQEISSYETSNFAEGWSYSPPSRYLRKPLPVICLILPSEKIGYIKQPLFNYPETSFLSPEKGEWFWEGVNQVALKNTQGRTMLDPPVGVIAKVPVEYVQQQMQRYNARVINLAGSTLDPVILGKLQWLRKQGYLVGMMTSGPSSKARIPGSKEQEEFLEYISKVAKNVDILGADEWFLSPSRAITEGGRITNFDPEFLNEFKKYSGYSDEDVVWAFQNWKSSDPRAVKAWEFCEKVQKDLIGKFVNVARQSNPKITLWISYITHNWNKFVTCIDRSVCDFDQILDCQTYWYGRFSGEDSMESPTLTAPIGLGKLEQNEYPDKFLWMGIDPGYTGKKSPDSLKNSWQKKFYYTSAEEIVPYLAILYASADGVFIQNPFLTHPPDKGTTDEFADMVRLVSSLVPRIKSYVKSDIAYYYDPQATWEIIRRENSGWASRETDRIALGFIQQFCDVDVTSDIKGYKNVISAGGLLPKVFDLDEQNIYFLGMPCFNEDGERVEEQKLSSIGVKDFRPLGTTFFSSITGDVRVESDLGHGWAIIDADIPLRTLSYNDDKDTKYTIGSQNRNGNIRVNSLWVSFLHQDTMRKIFKKDMDYFGWTKRDCPQVNGTRDIVGVSFRDSRSAVVDFGDTANYKKVKLIVFNGRDGVIRNEITRYQRRMLVDLPPFSVLVASGLK